MMGKLSAWRLDRKDASMRSASSGGMGGLVSIEELNSRAENSKLAKSESIKKRPKLHLRRKSFGLTKSPTRDANNPLSTPPLHNESLFSNFPAIDNNGPQSVSPSPPPSNRVHSRRPSAVSEHNLLAPHPDYRPKTADPTLARQRSKTAPSGSKYIMAWEDKPLPLAINKDSQSREMGLMEHASEKLKVVSAITRPRTTEGGIQQTRHGRSPSKGQYTLMPSVENPSSRRGSKSTITPIPRIRSRANSQTSNPREPPTNNHQVDTRNSILDEVEGTLTATITELQELQGAWHHDQPSSPPEGHFGPITAGQLAVVPDAAWQRSKSATRGRSGTQNSDSYFPQVETARSTPATPSKTTTFPKDQDSRVQSLQQAYSDQKKQNHALMAENENVKRRLDFVKSRLSEFETEKAALVRAAKEAEENLQSVLGRLREAKVGEQAAQNEFHAAKNEIAILQVKYGTIKEVLDAEKKNTERLEAKLEEVNAQKIDLIERQHEIQQEAFSTEENLKIVQAELIARDSLPATPVDPALEKKLEEVQRRNENLEAQLSQLSPNSDLPTTVAELTFRMDDLREQLKSKDSLIAALQSENSNALNTITTLTQQNVELSSRNSPSRQVSPTTTLSPTDTALTLTTSAGSPIDLQSSARANQKLGETQEALRKVRSERDAYAALLHAEVRRTTIEEHALSHPSAPFLRRKLDLDEAVTTVRGRAQKYLKGAEHNTDSHRDIDDLEREIEYYLNDIVLYKLDVKGYKKDLRRARERIKELSESGKDRLGSIASNSSGAQTVVGPDVE